MVLPRSVPTMDNRLGLPEWLWGSSTQLCLRYENLLKLERPYISLHSNSDTCKERSISHASQNRPREEAVDECLHMNSDGSEECPRLEMRTLRAGSRVYWTTEKTTWQDEENARRETTRMPTAPRVPVPSGLSFNNMSEKPLRNKGPGSQA